MLVTQELALSRNNREGLRVRGRLQQGGYVVEPEAVLIHS